MTAKERKVQKAKRISEKLELFDSVIYLLKDIITSLPTNKDWLNPETERIARQVIEEADKLQI